MPSALRAWTLSRHPLKLTRLTTPSSPGGRGGGWKKRVGVMRVLRRRPLRGLPGLPVLQHVVLQEVDLALAGSRPGVAVDRVAAVADDDLLETAVEPEVDQAADGEGEAEGPGHQGGSQEHEAAAQGAVEVPLAIEVAAAAEGAGLHPAVRTVGPALAGDRPCLAAVGAGELRCFRGQDGGEGEAAVAALGADAHRVTRGRP